MIKYILGLIIVLAIVIVAVTIGANNDQVINQPKINPKPNKIATNVESWNWLSATM